MILALLIGLNLALFGWLLYLWLTEDRPSKPEYQTYGRAGKLTPPRHPQRKKVTW